jgi:hypothetical protein
VERPEFGFRSSPLISLQFLVLRIVSVKREKLKIKNKQVMMKEKK